MKIASRNNISTCLTALSQRTEGHSSFQPQGVSVSQSHCRSHICQTQLYPPNRAVSTSVLEQAQLHLQSSNWVHSLIQPARWPVMWPSRTSEDGASCGATKRRRGVESKPHFGVCPWRFVLKGFSVVDEVYRSFTWAEMIIQLCQSFSYKQYNKSGNAEYFNQFLPEPVQTTDCIFRKESCIRNMKNNIWFYKMRLHWNRLEYSHWTGSFHIFKKKKWSFVRKKKP